MKVFFYQAECGDASRIRYKDEGKVFNLFIDSGFERTFREVLGAELRKLQNDGEIVDAWFVSHIHDDHIGGLMRYLDTIESEEFIDLVKEWYYNPPRWYNPSVTLEKKISESMSIGQGDFLYDYLHNIGKLPAFDIIAGTKLTLSKGFEVTVLSPSAGKLEKLRKKYKNANVPLEENEDQSTSEAAAAKSSDYHFKLEEFDLSKWSQDTSVENGSSISLLTTYANKNILWLADSHPSDIVRSLKALGHSNRNKIKCEWVKVTHHGSKANNSNVLYSLIECENYLISANGDNNNCLPSKETIARILRNANRSKNSHYRIYFTYDNDTLRNIFANEPDDVYKKLRFDAIYLKDAKYYEFDL